MSLLLLFNKSGNSYSQSVSDSFSLSDSLFYSRLVNHYLSDSISLSDQVVREYMHKIIDSITTAESLTKDYSKRNSDSVQLSDLLSKKAEIYRLIEESLTLTGIIVNERFDNISEINTMREAISTVNTRSQAVTELETLISKISVLLTAMASETEINTKHEVLS